MVALPATYDPTCVVCGRDAQCPCAWVEGTVCEVRQREYHGPHGRFIGAELCLQTRSGRCLLLLGERFLYLAEGLAEAPVGLTVRAYHLRRGEARSGSLPRLLTSAESLVVLEPDWLIDVTALKDTTYCLRQWLANRLAAQPETQHKVRGTLVHRCFATLCRDDDLSDAAVRAYAGGHLLDLALLGSTVESLLEAVAPHLERLRQWRALFGAELFNGEATPCYETTLLCPELGLRGRVDLALRRAGPDGRQLVTRVVELKTGKYNEEWPDPEFQVRGYYAILAGQQRLAPEFCAQVIYTGGANVVYRRVPCDTGHIQEVVACRNQAVLALLLGHAPPPRSITRCRKSSSRHHCVRLSTLLGLDHCRGRDLADAAAGDGDPLDARFYAEQYRLLRLEGGATNGALAQLWRSSPAEREALGTSIAVEATAPSQQGQDGRWQYRLACRNRSELRQGETVLLSDGDPVRGEVTMATLLQIGEAFVEVAAMERLAAPRLVDRYDNGEALDRTLRSLHAWLQAPEAVRALLYGQRLPALAPPGACWPATVLKEDPSPLPRGHARGKEDPSPLPRGHARGEEDPSPLPRGHARGEEPGQRLNARQEAALELALRARDYLLVQGPPGTGKTHLIACIARALVARGERVLLAAWTNQAVDTLLHALRRQGCHDFARLGSIRSMDPALAVHALLPQPAQPPAAGQEWDAGAVACRLRTVPILAGTVSALADARIGPETLRRDVLILDEAAQLSVAASVGALRLTRRFILVGDDQQLPPVVQSEEAAHEGLSLSPFALLRPEAQAAGALITLEEQYRMHAAIAAWPSEAFYGGRLTAHPSVASRLLPIAAGAAAGLLTAPEAPVVLVDAGGRAGREALLAAKAALALVRAGVPAEDVGVVAPFRGMVAAVRRLLEGGEAAACTVDTVDRFQGGQREVMVVCLGLEGIGRRGHAFVDDPRRLNVAFTRARAKLAVIGDLGCAATLPTLAGFLHHSREHGVPLVSAAQADALYGHDRQPAPPW